MIWDALPEMEGNGFVQRGAELGSHDNNGNVDSFFGLNISDLLLISEVFVQQPTLRL